MKRFALFLVPLALTLPGCDLFSGSSGCERGGAGPAADPRTESQPAAAQTAAETPAEGKQPSVSEKELSGPMMAVYKFTDHEGVVHYVDSLEKVPPKYRKQAHHPTGGVVTILPHSSIDELLEKRKIDPDQYRQEAGSAGPQSAGKHGAVVLYSTSWCPYCIRAREHLRRRGIAFVEKDIEKSTADLQEMLGKSGGSRGVPVIDVRGTVLRGYSPEALDRSLGR